MERQGGGRGGEGVEEGLLECRRPVNILQKKKLNTIIL